MCTPGSELKHPQKLIQPEALQQFGGREGIELGATCGKKSLDPQQTWRSAAQWASEREKGANALGQWAPTTNPKRSGFGEAGSTTTGYIPWGASQHVGFFVCSSPLAPGFYTVNPLQLPGWVAIGDRLALLLVLRPFQGYLAASEDSERTLFLCGERPPTAQTLPL